MLKEIKMKNDNGFEYCYFQDENGLIQGILKVTQNGKIHHYGYMVSNCYYGISKNYLLNDNSYIRTSKNREDNGVFIDFVK